MVKKLIKIFLTVVLLIAVVFGCFLLYITLSDYKPAEKTSALILNNNGSTLGNNARFSIITFNTGYCGLDKSQDFFMDGGKGSRSSGRAQTEKNMAAAAMIIRKDDYSFVLLQEVDVNSTRSFGIDQFRHYQLSLPGYGAIFATNYKVPWVPLPVLKPMGSVYSGIVTYSSFKVDSAARYQFPGGEKWPVQLFELDRCFIETRLSVENGKTLVLINTHLSAFDKGGEIRRVQLAYLKQRITAEYEKGNYVIAGGDWNHSLPGTDPALFKTTEQWPFWLQKLPDDFTPEGFIWTADPSVPTMRTDARPYVKDENFTAVIDGFLVSPNIIIISVACRNLDFENSDHNPVAATFELK